MSKMNTFLDPFVGKVEISDHTKKKVLYFAAAIGAWKLMKVAGDVTTGVWKHFLRPRHNLLKRYGSLDTNVAPWAVVTGGAGGIGKAYCKELSTSGFNVIIIDKDREGLAQTAPSLGVKVETICYDFANLGTVNGEQSLLQELDTKCAGKDVTMLVNNVAEFQHQLLIETPWDSVLRASNVNAHSYAFMCKYFVPRFLARHEKGMRSALINVGTCAAEPQNPRYQFSIYGATKAYGHILSSSMSEVYSNKFDVMTVIPRQTETTMNPAGYMFTAQPGDHAKAVFDQLGYESKTYGVFKHCLEYNLRWKYSLFGMKDRMVQSWNEKGNKKVIADYNGRN